MARRTTSKTSTSKRTSPSRRSSQSKTTSKTAPETSSTTPDATPKVPGETSDQPAAEASAKELPDPSTDSGLDIEFDRQGGDDEPAQLDEGAAAETASQDMSDAAPEIAPSDPAAPETATSDTPQDATAMSDLPDAARGERPVDTGQMTGANAAENTENVDPLAEQPQNVKADNAATAVPPTPPAQVVERRGGVFPLVLGGALAAGVGYGAHYVQTSRQPTQQSGPEIAALQAELADLRATVAELPAPGALAPLSQELSELNARIAALETAGQPDLSEVENAIEKLRSDMAGLPDFAELQSDLDELRAIPQVDLGPVEEGVATLEARLAPLPDQIATLQTEMADLRALATEEVKQAEAAVDTALAQAGLDRVSAALVTGAPFDAATAQLADAGIAVPDALEVTAPDGVRTVESLQEGYGEAARAAISASLQNAPADSATEKLGNFFRAQVGARSLSPREGDDPDAITSRAGVAVAEGDLAAALDELSALPDAGLAAMDDWLSAAQTRLDAAAAFDALQSDITTK